MSLDTPSAETVQDTDKNMADGHDVGNLSPTITSPESSNSWHSFSGNDNENRYLRLRCSAALAAFNAQNLTTSAEERATAWHK